MKAEICSLVLISALGAVPAMAQAPRFDVASVKVWPAGAPAQIPGDLGESGVKNGITPTGISFQGYPLGLLIRWAYGLHLFQASETVGPDWLEPGFGCVRFDVQAKTGRPATVEQLRLMLRTLLAERLKVAVHRENRGMTVCVLSAAKGGPKVRPSEKETMTIRQEGDLLHFQGAVLARLDDVMYVFVPYLILDETGLPGRYDFDLDFMQYRDLAVSGPGRAIDMTPSVNKALQPLGLRLDEKRRTIEVLVIDHAEKVPTEN
jgi:uncharacterized protein (TIGR03435 family)